MQGGVSIRINNSNFDDTQTAIKNAIEKAPTKAKTINIFITEDLEIKDALVNVEPSSGLMYVFSLSGNNFKGKTININGNGKTTKILNEKIRFLYVDGCSVNLKNLILDGGKEENIYRDKALIQIEQSEDNNSVLSVDKSVTIRNSTNRLPSPGENEGLGAAIFNGGGTLNMAGTVTDCDANFGGAIYTTGTLYMRGNIKKCASVSGGAIYSCNAVTNVYGNISDCVADDSGGAAFTSSGGELYFYGNIINCNATKNGGAIRNGSGTLYMHGVIDACESKIGGAICNQTGRLYVYGGIKDCQAARAGAIFNGSSGELYFCGNIDHCRAIVSDDCPINQDFGNGGAIFNGTNGKLYMCGDISYCTAAGSGGAILYGSGEAYFLSGVINFCSSDKNGDAVCFYVDMKGVRIAKKDAGTLVINLDEKVHGEGATEADNICGHNNLFSKVGYQGMFCSGDTSTWKKLDKYQLKFVNTDKNIDSDIKLGDYEMNVSSVDGFEIKSFVDDDGKVINVLQDGKFRNIINTASKDGIINLKSKNIQKYVANGHIVLDKNSKPTNYSGVMLPFSSLQKVPEPKHVIFDFCGQTIHHNDPNVPLIQTLPGQHVTICNLNMDGSGCK